MSRLSDITLRRLQAVAVEPDFTSARYRLLEPIGAGGMGAVYRASDDELQREVAIKVMHDTPLAVETAERTLREARVIARLEHPGIVPVYDVGRLPAGRIFYVMKLVRGQRLDQKFAGSGPIAERLRVFERICETVAFAHAHGVIHRDLKPQNIMLGQFGEVMVMDWGIAKVAGREDPAGDTSACSEGAAPNQPAEIVGPNEETRLARTRMGVVLGTPAYMSPEQARGRMDLIDQRSDVFALGAILYFLLTGAAPQSATRFDRSARGKEPAFDSPRDHNRAVPRSLAAVCARAMAAEPARRYWDAGALAGEIARFAAGQRVDAYPETPWERACRLARKFRFPLLLIGAYLLMRTLLEFFSPAG